MSVYKKVQQVEKLFRLAEKDVATFQQATSLKCKSSCGMCCLKPDIAASPLEFLPLAYHLYKKDLDKYLPQRPDNLMQRKADHYG